MTAQNFPKEVYWSVQFRKGGLWITEKTRLENLEDAQDLADALKANSACRVRINRHEIYREEV